MENIARTAYRANAIITLLLANMRNDAINETTFERYSMQRCIEEALEDFPFRADEKAKVHIDKTIDFDFNWLDTGWREVAMSI